jgi:signal transduction histidine kinase
LIAPAALSSRNRTGRERSSGSSERASGRARRPKRALLKNAGSRPPLYTSLQRVQSARRRVQAACESREAALPHGVSRVDTLTELLRALAGSLTGAQPVLISDFPTEGVRCLRLRPNDECQVVVPSVNVKRLFPASGSPWPISLGGASATRLSRELEFQPPLTWFYLVPVTVPGYFSGAFGVGVVRWGAGPASAAGAALSRLELMSLLRTAKRDVEVFLRQAALRERLYSAGAADTAQELGQDIHDSVLQELSYSVLQLSVLEGRADLPDDARRILQSTQEDLRSAARELRDIATEAARTSAEIDLPSELQALVERFGKRFSGAVELDIQGARRDPGTPISRHIMRIAAEALANVLKHARATGARVCLKYGTDSLELTISDDGEGFQPLAVDEGHLGLSGMRRRLDKIGGTLQIEPGSPHGVVLRVNVAA